MELFEKAALLRVFIGESDHWNGKPLHEAIVMKARAEGLAGATVLRGIMGFGATSRVIHTAKVLRLSDDLPLVVEIVDHPDRIESFLAHAAEMLGGGLVTIEELRVAHYQHDESKKA